MQSTFSTDLFQPVKSLLDLIREEQEQAAAKSRGWGCRHDFAGIEINRWDEGGKGKRVDWRLKKKYVGKKTGRCFSCEVKKRQRESSINRTLVERLPRYR